MRPGQRDGGTASIEMLALLPFVVIVLGLLMQVLLMAYTANAAGQAARDAARAYSLEQSPVTAAQRSLPPGVTLVSAAASGGIGHGVSVTVLAPRAVFLGDRSVTRSVVMP